MTTKVDKAIVTNRTALVAKYADGADEIVQAVLRMIAANTVHGLTSVLVELDDAGAMQVLNAPPVTAAADPAQNKAAIDGVYTALVPDYVMILGATDVVPHLPMKNPMFTGPDGGDPDEFAYGDVPYACEAPYGDDPAAFVGPTRVVGRLPDVVGATDATYLIGLLENATTWRTGSRDDYASYLGITAKVWTGSTTLSLKTVFGSADDLKSAPPDGPNWDAALLGRRSHFINCHGAEADDHFYGQEGNTYPIAVDGTLIGGHVTTGTVVAAECCYGAELFDPTNLAGPGICNVYLGSGAYGFWGSSTIAYGPADTNGSADFMCQLFMTSVLAGASLGRAALEARQRFVETVTTVDPADLKTLAQYSLFGDPSIHPVRVQTDAVAVPEPPHAARGAAAEDAKGILGEPAPATPIESLTDSIARAARRSNLAAIGLSLLGSTAVAQVVEGAAAAGDVLEQLRSLSQEPELTLQGTKTFRVIAPRIAGEMHAMLAAVPDLLHVSVAREPKDTGPQRIVAVIGRERAGKIVSFRKLFGK